MVYHRINHCFNVVFRTMQGKTYNIKNHGLCNNSDAIHHLGKLDSFQPKI